MQNLERFKDRWLSRALSKAGARFASALDGLQKGGECFLSEALVAQGLLSPEEVGRLVERSFGIPYSDPKPESLDKLALKLLPDKLCRRHRLIPLRLDGEHLEVLMANPLDLDAQSDAAVVSGREIKACFGTADRITQLIEAAHGRQEEESLPGAQFEEVPLEVLEEKAEEEAEAEEEAGSGPVSKLVNHLFVSAVRMRASDIHVEQYNDRTVVRFRVDGHLRTIMNLPKRIGAGPLVSRIKIMGSMDVSERRRPLDGRAKLRVDGFEIGLRISTLPTSFGEKVVIRILDKRQAEIPFETLGFRPQIQDQLERILKNPKGMFLITGSTGSGKTTTLYSCLHRLKGETVNIVTVEDPVEYKLEGINQVQVNEKAGLGFAAALRSVLRQDPDVVLIGEMRDQETAEIAFQAAMTGHMVFSTLHANDCVSTITRLEQMGIDRFKIASPINAISAQKLVRKLCARCRRQVPEEEIPASLRKALEARGLPRRLYAPSGCGFCSGIGYRGRQVVVELLVLTEQLRGLIARGSDEAALRREALKNGWLLPMAEDVYWHLSAGSTSWEEASALLEAESGGLASPKAAAANGPRKISKFPLAGRSILVVDDEAPVRNLIRRILEAYGCAVREASEGAEGLRMFAEQAPDLVVLDLNMPVMGGLDMIQAVRSRQRFWNVPILILTAAEGAQSQELALESGADDYVSKPFEAQVLLARVRALFRRLEWAEASERSAEDPALCALAAGAAVLRPDTGGA